MRSLSILAGLSRPFMRFGLLALASYGLLYFSYKYYVPMRGNDFLTNYYFMYRKPLNLGVAIEPFIYRQISAVLTHLFYDFGIWYPDKIAFVDAHYDQKLFFSALFTNYVGLVLAGTIAGSIVERESGGFIFPLLAGLFCLFSFHAQSVVVTGLTEGVTWSFVALSYLLYIRQSRVALAILLALSIFQRELIPVIFATIAILSIAFNRHICRYNLFVLSYSVLCFLAYVAINKILGLPGHHAQLSLNHLIAGLTSFRRSAMVPLIFQALFSQNIIIISVAVGALQWIRTRTFPVVLPILLLVFFTLALIGFIEGIGNNIGRIAGMLTPIFAAVAASSMLKLETLMPIAREAGSGA